MHRNLVDPQLAPQPPKVDCRSAVTDRELCCGSMKLPLAPAQVMAVINVTPDSFSDGGQVLQMDSGRLRALAQEMVGEGASLIDIGGESTRPGAAPVSEDEECRRVLPVLELLLDLDVVVSIDTSKAGVARRAIELGCHMVNDVSALADPGMLDVLADSSVALTLMHMQGRPRTMQKNPSYVDVVGEVYDYLEAALARCRAHGISADRLCVDPGFGFGKTLTHNLRLLQQLSVFQNLGVALMAGLSRKSMLGVITGRAVTERVYSSAAAALLAVERGADIVRVHDVGATVDVLKMLRAVQFGDWPDEQPCS
jgi:dihydropteroate synthase